MITLPLGFTPSYNCKFVTLTYKKSLRFIDGWKRDLPLIVKYINKCGEYSLVPEIGDNGCFHWHYIIKISDNFKHNIFLNMWVKGYGYIKSVNVSNYLGAFIYIRKQSFSTKEYLEAHLNTESEELISIVTRSTSPLALQKIKSLIRYGKNNIKKINQLVDQIASIKGTIFEYYEQPAETE